MHSWAAGLDLIFCVCEGVSLAKWKRLQFARFLLWHAFGDLHVIMLRAPCLSAAAACEATWSCCRYDSRCFIQSLPLLLSLPPWRHRFLRLRGLFWKSSWVPLGLPAAGSRNCYGLGLWGKSVFPQCVTCSLRSDLGQWGLWSESLCSWGTSISILRSCSFL